MSEKWTPVCEVCHMRPKMDRSVCCEDCWYSGAYARWWDAQANPRVPRGFCPEHDVRDVFEDRVDYYGSL